jgi:probable HAF family extracellular repeat protein
VTHRARDRHRHSVGDRKQRLRRIERPFLEELEIRTLLTATLSDIGIVDSVTGLNSAVEVVGNTTGGGGYAFLLDSNGIFHNLGNLSGYAETVATGISANGQVIGYSIDPVSNSSPDSQALVDVNGMMTSLGTLVSQQGDVRESEAVGINDSGQIVGWSTVNGAAIHAFLYSNGQMTDLSTLGGASHAGSSVANAINDSGQIVGNTTVVNGSGLASQQAFLDANGVMTALGTPYGTEESDANAINSSGQIVGNAGDPSSADGLGQHAILWSNGTATDLGTLPGDSFADATSINDSGVIVGDSYADSSKSQIGHAFVYENGVMTDLNSLLPANSGYVLNTATEIDNADEICGMASYEGHIHGYVLYLSGSTTPPGTLASTIVVQSSGPTSLYGQTINLNAVVTASTPGSGTPTGSVTFLDGSTTLGTVVLQDDQATLSITNLMVGPHSITGIYSGDSQFTASTSAVVSTSVEQDPTSLNLISSANAADAGQPVTFTATVSPDAPGSGTPTGTVTFEDGMTALGSASLSGGKAIFTTSGLAPGSHSISVQYGGNGDFLASDSAAFTLTVIASSFPTQPVPTQSAPTQSALTTSARSSTHGKPVTLTDTVKLRGAVRGTPTGTVMFMNGGKVLRTVALKRGKAVLKTASLPLGSVRIQAVYAGDGSFEPSTSAILVERIVAARPRKARAHRARALKAAARSLAPAGPLPRRQITRQFRITLVKTGLDSVIGRRSVRFKSYGHFDTADGTRSVPATGI